METIKIREEEQEDLTSWANDNNLEVWEIVRRVVKHFKQTGGDF